MSASLCSAHGSKDSEISTAGAVPEEREREGGVVRLTES